MSALMHPLAAVTIACALSAVAVVIAFRVQSIVKKMLLSVLAAVLFFPAALLLVMLHPELIDARHRAYKAFYRDIDIGMTRQQVFALASAHYPAAGLRMRPRTLYDKPEEIVFFMDPEARGEPNCEGILLTLSDNRVTQKRYSAD
jgi:hypothetical protein